MTEIYYDRPFYHFACPWCGTMVEVHEGEINCQKFVCGIDKVSGMGVHPHMSEETALAIFRANTAWGCLHPFFFDGKVVLKRTYG